MATAARPRAPASGRPLSPHLSIWKWRVHTITSITHRITGNAMAFGAVVLFLWWLVAAATGPAAYATFYAVATGWVGIVVGIGLTWTLFQHMASGIRHLVMDTGAGYDLDASRLSATATYIVSLGATAVTWALIVLTKGI
jgi:succinate dehydrogenase / fumarate reductase cytochrome b subunit